MLVALHTIVEHDSTVSELADLSPGWVARRENVGGPWRKSRDDQNAA